MLLLLGIMIFVTVMHVAFWTCMLIGLMRSKSETATDPRDEVIIEEIRQRNATSGAVRREGE